jgi:hypothetical protein
LFENVVISTFFFISKIPVTLFSQSMLMCKSIDVRSFVVINDVSIYYNIGLIFFLN